MRVGIIKVLEIISFKEYMPTVPGRELKVFVKAQDEDGKIGKIEVLWSKEQLEFEQMRLDILANHPSLSDEILTLYIVTFCKCFTLKKN